MRCLNCGWANPSSAIVCEKCHTPLVTAPATQAPRPRTQAPRPAAAASPTPQRPQPQPHPTPSTTSTPQDPHEVPVGGCIDGQYTVLSILGRGTFGIVYLVRDAQGNQAALKMLKLWEIGLNQREGIRQRFRLEYETGQIPSPYLVHSLTMGEHEGNPYFVMEYCPGGDLRAHLRRGGDINQAAMQVLRGLRDLHEQGKIHRDLKPSNVLMREDGTAVLTDFGISGDQNKRMTERGEVGKPRQIFGTYGFMPPEQVRPPRGGRATVLPTTDIFSFGVMMYCLIVGHLPFGSLHDEADLMPYLTRGRRGEWDRQALIQARGGQAWLPAIERCLEPDFHLRAQNVNEVMDMVPRQSCRITTQGTQGPVTANDIQQGGLVVRILQGPQHGRVYCLSAFVQAGRDTVHIGRSDTSVHNDINIQDDEHCYISRRHCTLLRKPETGEWYVRDGQRDDRSTTGWNRSLNGTYVNSTELGNEPVKLHLGDIITLGETKLKIELEA